MVMCLVKGAVQICIWLSWCHCQTWYTLPVCMGRIYGPYIRAQKVHPYIRAVYTCSVYRASLSLAVVNPDWFYLPGFTFLMPAHPGSSRQNPRRPHPHLIHPSLDWVHLLPQTACRSNQLFFHNSPTGSRDRLGYVTSLFQHPLMLYRLYCYMANNNNSNSSALRLLFVWQEGQPACKKLSRGMLA